MPTCKGCGKYFVQQTFTQKYCKNPCKAPSNKRTPYEKWIARLPPKPQGNKRWGSMNKGS